LPAVDNSCQQQKIEIAGALASGHLRRLGRRIIPVARLRGGQRDTYRSHSGNQKRCNESRAHMRSVASPRFVANMRR
jgi:hypothetical protein